MTKLLVVSLLLVFWIGGSSYWYVCKVRNNCGHQIQNMDMYSIQKESNPISENVASAIDSIDKMVPDSIQNLNLKILETEKYLQEIGNKILYFEFASAQTVIQSADRAYFEKLVFYLKHKPDKVLVVNGYSDNKGTPEGNAKFSSMRANFVKTYLLDLGIAPKQIELFAKGDANPIATNDTDEGRAKNRRVEILISKL